VFIGSLLYTRLCRTILGLASTTVQRYVHIAHLSNSSGKRGCYVYVVRNPQNVDRGQSMVLSTLC